MAFFDVNKKVNSTNSVDPTIDAVYSFSLSSETEKAETELEQISALFYSGANYCINDLNFLSKSMLLTLANARPLYCALVAEKSNHLAGDNKTMDGLSEFGKLAVKILCANKIGIDLKDLSERAFLEIMQIATTRAFVTKAKLSGLGRLDCLRPYQEQILVDSDANIVLDTTCDGFTPEEFAESVAKFVKKFGSKNLMLATYDMYGKKAAKRLQKIESELKLVGLNYDQIADIFYGNAYRRLPKPIMQVVND